MRRAGRGLSVAYVRMPRLFEELRIAHGDGSFGKRLTALGQDRFTDPGRLGTGPAQPG